MDTIGTYCSCIQQLVLTVLVFNNWYLLFLYSTIGTYCSLTISTNCCIHMVYLLMMGCRYVRNMYRCLTKYTDDKLCIKLVFL